MEKEGWGGSNNDVSIGAKILVRAALSEEFVHHSGDYFDNDRGRFSEPHSDALNPAKNAQLLKTIEQAIAQ